ncbi:MAG: protein kinase [Anaerolineae bacterium]
MNKAITAPKNINASNFNGRYILEDEIGRGGMGVVYRATDRLTGDVVALKQVIMSADENDEEHLIALAHEFQTLAGLRHPHIISVLAYGFDPEKRPFFTMTYLPKSQTILEAAKGKSFEQKIEFVQQLLQALAYLHRRGVLHRDLKPENILVCDGVVRVLDFGLSANSEVRTSLSAGTPLYMAPELFNEVDYTELADLYALGTICYQLFTGQHPFEPFDYRFIDRVTNEEPDWTRIDKRLRPFLSQLLEKQPEMRPARAAQALTLLAKSLDQTLPKETKAIRESFLQAATFIGREKEFRQLTGAMDQAKEGNGSGWLIGGESGSGKSRLVRELETNALVAGFHVLQGQAMDQGGAPYQLLRHPLRYLLTISPKIDAFVASRLKLIIPDIEQILGRSISDPPILEEKQQKEQLVEAVVRLFQQQTAPLMLLLEDLQWTSESLAVVSQLHDIAATAKLIIVGTYRSDDWKTLPSLIANMKRIEVARFTKEETADFAKAMLGSFGASEKLCDILQKETEGNPFFLVEVVRLLAEQAGQLAEIDEGNIPAKLLPDGIQTIVQQRLFKLALPERKLMQLAAIAGKQLDLDVMETLKKQSDLEHISLAQWLTNGNIAAILAVENDQWHFAHDKIRMGILEEIDPANKGQLYGDVAWAFEAHYGEIDDFAERLAGLWRGAADPIKEQQYSFTAGQLAAKQFRNDEALTFYKRAYILTPEEKLSNRLDILLAQAKLLFTLGLNNEQEQLFNQIQELAEELGDANYFAEFYLRRIFYDFSVGDMVQTIKNSRAALQYAEQTDNRLAQGTAYRFLGSVDVALGQIQSSITNFERSLQINLANDNPYEIAISKMLLAGTIGTYGRHIEAQALLDDAVTYLQQFEVKNREAISLSYRATNGWRMGQLEMAQRDAQHCYELALVTGDRMANDLAPSTLSLVANAKGNLDDAWELSNQAVAIMRKNKNLFYLGIALQDQGAIAIRKQAWPEVQAAYKEALDIYQLFGDQITIFACQAGLGRAAIMLDQPAEDFTASILAYLDGNSDLQYVRYPITFCLNAYYAIRENHPNKAALIVERGHQLLQTRAEQFAVAEDRSAYLDKLNHHLELITLYETLSREEATSNIDKSRLAISETINGRYQLHDKLGEGGMGIVYRATDRLTGDTVALKQVTNTESENDETYRLGLAHEFQTLAGLRHPHIISVLDYGFNNEKRPFFTMTHLEDPETILVAAQNRSLDEKIGLIQKLLQALAYLHRRGVLHRDLKPENVLVSNGNLRVLDFGLAVSEKVAPNSLAGTPYYMAPESINDGEYTVAADLYSVGVLCYQLLTGKHPFEPLDHAFLNRVLGNEPNLETIDSRLRPFLAKILAKTPGDRFDNATTAIMALAKAVDQPLPKESAAIRESYLQAAKFIGREKEMAQLETTLKHGARGKGSALLISGESGVGKSRLLNELRTKALVRGFLVLHGQAKQEGGGLPFQLWREPLQQALMMASEVDDLTASILRPLIPNISKLLQRDVAPAPQLTDQAARLRLFNAIATLLQKTGQPVLLILEDLHWTSESLLPIPYLNQQISKQPWLILGSYRHDEKPNLPSILPTIKVLTLDRLTPEMVTEFSAAMLGEVGRRPEVVSLLQRETEGNAFFAVEMVRALTEKVEQLTAVGEIVLPETLLPNGIQDIIKNRLVRVPAPAKELLVLAAVAGRELEIPLITILANGVDIENWWLPICSEAAVLEIRHGTWQFSHAKIQEGVLAQLDKKSLTAKHEQVALAIERLHPNDPEQAGRLAYHWRHTDKVKKEIAYNLQAGKHASSQFSHEDAIIYFSEALKKTPLDRKTERYNILLARENTLEASAHDRIKQQVDLTELAELADQLDDPAKRAEVSLRQAKLYGYTSQFEKAMVAAQFVIEQGELAQNERIAIAGHTQLGHIARWSNQYDIAQSHLEYSVKRSRELEDARELGAALNNLGLFYASIGQFERERECYDEALVIAKQLNEMRLESRIYNNLSLNSGMRGDLSNSKIYIEKSLQLDIMRGDLTSQAISEVNYGIYFYDTGDYQAAFTPLENSVANFQKLGDQYGLNLGLFYLALLADKTKQYEDTIQLVEESIEQAKELNLKADTGKRLTILGYICKQQKKFEKAQDLFSVAVSTVNGLDSVKQLTVLANLRFHQAGIAHEQQSWNIAADHYLDLLEIVKNEPQTADTIHLAAQSGLAAVYLAQGKVEQALTQAEPAIANLLNDPLTGKWNHMWAALHCFYILQAAHDARAMTILKKAYKTLQTMHELIEDENAQRFLLEQVPEHQKIVGLYKTLTFQEPEKKVLETVSTNGQHLDAVEKAESYLDSLASNSGGGSLTQSERKILKGEPLLARLLAISNRMAEIRTLDPLLSYAIDEVLSLVGAEQGYIVLVSPDGEVEYRMRRQSDNNHVQVQNDAISHSVLNEVIQTKKGLVVRNALFDPRFAAAVSVVNMQLRSIMCAPLVSKNNIIGAIYVENRSKSGRFNAEDLAPLEFFSNQAAVAIENANINDENVRINENLETLVDERTRELETAKDAAESANQAKTTFLSNMSHELRTPLNAILNFSAFVKEGYYGDVNDEQSLALGNVIDSGHHLLNLINDILDANKIEAGMMSLFFEDVDLTEAVQSVLQTATGLVTDQDIELIVQNTDNLPTIRADRLRLRQILLNILSNAVKYTQQGRVIFDFKEDHESVTFSIQDSGIGISDEDAELVFQSFVQARSNPGNVVSTGLGLPITKKMVELHHGQIWFESTIGKGTTFFIQLPKKQK